MPLPPGVQRAALRARLARPLLPLHRGRPIRSSTSTRPGASSRACSRARCRRWTEATEVATSGSRRRVVASSRRRRSSSRSALAGCRAGHARPAEVQAARARARSSPTGAPRGRWSPGTVARGHLDDDQAFFTRRVGGRRRWRALPLPVDARPARRAASERYDIYCSPCHDRAGTGDGHDRAARLQAAAVVPHRSPARRARRLLLRRRSPTASASCRATRRRCRRATAGRSSPTSARCSSASTPRSPTCRTAERARELGGGATDATRARALSLAAGPHPRPQSARRCSAPARSALVACALGGAGRPGAVLPLLPGRLPLLDRHRARLARPAHAATTSPAAPGAWPSAACSSRRRAPCRSCRCSSCRMLFGLADLYEWAQPEHVAHDPLLQHKALYLNVPFFLARAVFYFAVWIVARALSRRAGRASRTRPATRRWRSACELLGRGGLLLYAPDHDVRVDRLGDVARAALVLDHLRHPRSSAARC